MLYIDLSHTIDDGMPVFPGTPEVRIQQFSTVENEGYAEKELKLATHIGTHMDAPAHMIANGKTLDQFQISDFAGSALLIPFSWDDLEEMDQVEYFTQFESEIRDVDFIILKTAWSDKWGTEGYFKDFPALDKIAAQYFSGFRLKGIGTDAISIDLCDSVEFEAHHELLGNEILIIENLKNLEKIRTALFDILVFPLKVKDADGSPVRAVAQMK